ncbi:hypothetical protein GQ55_4G042000 [Panicum hallii var. hallii]|uniref:Uncharacterized protein n=1 Tax=Panicum hallii var. hallii TaxID=1504633 RepID=A0A2T7DV34_9POAL|nr:hypothetical protein GQ55_4G042000 [Panicum hallii var. hallii]
MPQAGRLSGLNQPKHFKGSSLLDLQPRTEFTAHEVAGCGVYSVDLALLTDSERRNHKRPYRRHEPPDFLVQLLQLILMKPEAIRKENESEDNKATTLAFKNNAEDLKFILLLCGEYIRADKK